MFNPKFKSLLKGLGSLLSGLLVECRRLVSLIFIPWVGIILFCILASWYTIFVYGLDALLAPVLKTWLVLKPFILQVLKLVPAALLWVWVNTFAKLGGWFSEIFLAIVGYLGGWKAWSLKKLVRQLARFFVSFTTRFVLITVVLNLLFGRERKGVKRFPALVTTRLKRSPFARVINWWGDSTERQKRLIIGIALCVVLVFAGQALLGFSILLFDLLWEVVLLIVRWLVRLWRFVLPIALRFVPNAVMNFISTKLLPVFADIVPIVRDDHRVMYLRFNLQRRYRNLKAYLFKKSRSKRSGLRGSVRPFIGARIRSSKTSLIDAAASIADNEDNKKK